MTEDKTEYVLPDQDGSQHIRENILQTGLEWINKHTAHPMTFAIGAIVAGVDIALVAEPPEIVAKMLRVQADQLEWSAAELRETAN